MRNWLAQLPRSFRTLVRDAGFSLPVLLCLALTIGAAAAVFSVVDAVLLKPLPIPDEHRIRSVFGFRDGTDDQQYGLAAASVLALATDSDAFSSVGWWRQGTVALTGGDEPLQLDSTGVGPDLFATLGVRPLLGGNFSAAARSGERVAYLNETLWLSEFGGDSDIVGRRVFVDDVPTTIAGVVAARAALPPDADIWLPLLVEDIPDEQLHSGNMSFVGRMIDGLDDVELARRLARVDSDLEQVYPREYRTRSFGTESLRALIIGDDGRLLPVLLIAVGLLLVLGCANVANLVLVRNRGRRVAVATRSALGASQTTIVGWLVGELVILSGLAAAAGASLAALLAPAILRLTGIAGPGIEARVLDIRTLSFTAAITLVASLAVGLAPAMGLSRLDLAPILRDGAGRSSGTRLARRSQGLLIAAQAAMGVLLMIAAGQTLIELQRLGSADPGYRSEGLLTFNIQAPGSRYPERSQFLQLFSQVRETLAALPGVEQAGGAARLPVGYPGTWFSLSIRDQPPANPDHVEFAKGYPVSDGYLQAMGIRLVAGRLFDETDSEDGAPAVVVSQAFANRYWPGETALGKLMKRRTYASNFPWMTVVGVVEDVPSDGLAEGPGVAIYLPQEQTITAFSRTLAFVLQTDRPAEQLVPEIRARMAMIDPDLPLARIETIEQLIHDANAERRLAGGLLAVFACIGLVLLGTGTYGVVAFAVAQRQVEFGLRSALGADTGRLLRMVLADNLVYLAGGTLVGLTAATVSSRLLDAGVLPPAPPALYVAAAIALLGIGVVASLRPALRAARLDPTLSLRGGIG